MLSKEFSNKEPKQNAAGNGRCTTSFVSHWFYKVISLGGSRLPAAVLEFQYSAAEGAHQEVSYENRRHRRQRAHREKGRDEPSSARP